MAETYIDENGYRRFSDSDKLVHRWVAEKNLGRTLKPKEVIHHINRNKLDNSWGNLWVFKNQKGHNKVHTYDSYRFGAQASYMGFNNECSNNSGCMISILLLASVISACSYCINYL